MKKIIIIIVLMLINRGYSQKINNVEKGVLKLSILTPSIEYELGLTKKTTLNFSIGTSLNIEKHDSIYNDKVFFGLTPVFGTQYRYYYNLDRRLKKGKNIGNNSGNYFSLLGKYELGDAIIGKIKRNHSNSFFVGTLYGVQRSYRNKMFFNVEGGIGLQKYDDNNDYIDTAILINMKFGWMFNKKKKKH